MTEKTSHITDLTKRNSQFNTILTFGENRVGCVYSKYGVVEVHQTAKIPKGYRYSFSTAIEDRSGKMLYYVYAFNTGWRYKKIALAKYATRWLHKILNRQYKCKLPISQREKNKFEEGSRIIDKINHND